MNFLLKGPALSCHVSGREGRFLGGSSAIRFLSFWWAFDPVTVKLFAGDLRTAQILGGFSKGPGGWLPFGFLIGNRSGVRIPNQT